MGVLSDASVGAKNFVVNHREHQDRLELSLWGWHTGYFTPADFPSFQKVPRMCWRWHLVLIVDNLTVSDRLVLCVKPMERGRWFCFGLIVIPCRCFLMRITFRLLTKNGLKVYLTQPLRKEGSEKKLVINWQQRPNNRQQRDPQSTYYMEKTSDQ